MSHHESLFQKSQKKIDNLKKSLQAISLKEMMLADSEKEIENEIAAFRKKSNGTPEVKVSLSVESVVKATLAVMLVIGAVYLVGFIKAVLILFLVALFLSATLSPAVDSLQKHHVPRPLGILIIYAIVLGIFITIFTSLVPIIAQQISSLAHSAKGMIENILSNQSGDSWFMIKIEPWIKQISESLNQTQVISNLSTSLQELGSQLTNIAGNALGAVLVIFNGLFNMILVLIVTFFMIMNREHTTNFFHSLFPTKYSGYINLKMKQVSLRIGEWVRGQVLLALAMGVLAFTIFSILGLNYATTLAMVAALGEFIPYLGPIITFVSAFLIALNQDPHLALWLIPAYGLIQFIESNIMVPLIVGRSVGLNPVVIIFAILCGAAIGSQVGGSPAMGFLGMILAVPMANIISIFIEDYTAKHK
jgi:predicted PurR-regulated permease PerM